MSVACTSAPPHAPMVPTDRNSDKPQQQSMREPIHTSVLDKLDPLFVNLYNDYLVNTPPPPSDLSAVRQSYSALYAFATAPATGVGGIGETQVPGWSKYPGDVAVRVYVPPGETPGERKIWPVHFNFHGGGWAVGDLESSAHICHHICATVPCCVIDIEYRLVPEFPFPIGVMDGLSAVTHILSHHHTFSIDPTRVTLGGESSGATIALILNHLFRDAGYTERIKGIVAGTPTISDVRKYVAAEQSPWPSMREAEFAPLFDWQKLKWFDAFKWMSLGNTQDSTRHGMNGANGTKIVSAKEKQQDLSWFSNALTAPSFKNLAPLTWIGTAEVDPLRDEAEAYAKICEENGNKVILRRFEGVPHPFMHMDKLLPQGREYVEDVIRHIRMCLYTTQPKTVDKASTSNTQASTAAKGAADE